jgi:hypothetical protein
VRGRVGFEVLLNQYAASINKDACRSLGDWILRQREENRSHLFEVSIYKDLCKIKLNGDHLYSDTGGRN